jgi:hypothetical protein
MKEEKKESLLLAILAEGAKEVYNDLISTI